jgi:anti-anti-sigma regulatory factor
LIEMVMGNATGEVVVRLTGDPGIRQAGELTAALVGLSALRPPIVTLDLSRLHAISCLTLGDLAAFRRGLVRAGSRVCLGAGLQQPVRAALERAGLLVLFDSPGQKQ